jgi:glycosyltransferase involved in cell wall biosynthesis
VVIDVQNGIPFFSRLVARCPVILLVHHVHREQWPVVYGRTIARVGWFVESRLSPRIYRGCQYVAVSEITRHELTGLGVRASDIAVVHNGTDPPRQAPARAPDPRVLVLARLVPHKRVEHVLRAAAGLRDEFPRMRVRIVGDGWWSPRLQTEAARLGVADIVDFLGHVDESTKHSELAAAWVNAVPSLKEGWGLTVMEAAAYAVPTIAYRSGGGLAESVVDGVTGILVEDSEEQFAAALRRVIVDESERGRLGEGAEARSHDYSWSRSTESFAVLLRHAAYGLPPLAGADPKPTAELPAALVAPVETAPSL